MPEAFIIKAGSRKKIVMREIFEKLSPVHKGCGGEIVCAIDASDWILKLICLECQKRVEITDAQQREIIAAMLTGRKTKINDRIVVIPKKGAD